MNQKDMFSDDDSFLNKLKEQWETAIMGDGGNCPCCGKWGKVYKYKLSQHLALALRWIVVHGKENGWVHVQNTAPRWMLKSKTYPLLAHWKLIEHQSNRSGIWRATYIGTMFSEGQINQPSAVYIYDNDIWGFDSAEVSFRGCFGDHFDFDEMMSTRFDWSKVKPETRRKK